MEVFLIVADQLVPSLGGHLERVSRTAGTVARELDLDQEEVELIAQAGLYHDIAKLLWPEHLRQGAPKGKDDIDIIRRHPIEGANMLAASDNLAPLYPLVRHHHERFDGAGIPDGLVGEEIPLGARIIAVCDTADAITRERNYDPARPQEEMRTILADVAGSQLDPEIVEIYLRLEQEPGF